MTDPIKSYKGFNKDMTCHGFAYEVGKSYSLRGIVRACESGFHACKHPLDVFKYYPPSTSRFAEVLQSGALSRGEYVEDSKVASSDITIVAEIGLHDMIERAVTMALDRGEKKTKHVTGYRSAASATGYQGAASATGYQGAASATGDKGAASATGYQGTASATGIYSAASATGDQGAASATSDCGAASATGNRGAASATGDGGVASATGDGGAASATGNYGVASATGVQGAASATGYQGRVMGSGGNALFLTRRDSNYTITHVWAGIVGQNGIKPGVWYTLNENGEPAEVE